MAARLSNKRQTASAPPREAKPGDNLAPEERRKAEEEAEAIALISVVSAVKALDPEVEQARSALKAVMDKRTDVFRMAKAQHGFQRKEIQELVDDSKADARKNVTEAEARRYRFRLKMGLPVGMSETEQDLMSRLPDVEKDAAFWRAAGYTAGISAGDTNPPVECVAAGHVGPWSQGVKDGIAINGAAIKQMKAPKAPPPKPPSDEPKTVAEEQAEERKAIERGKAALAQMKPIPEPDPNAKPDDFEAPKEELDAQSTRRAVVDAKAGATTGEPGDDGEGV